MATTDSLNDRIDIPCPIKDDSMDLCGISRLVDLVEDVTNNTKNNDEMLPVLADDLLNLCDNYNLYLINEEVVYTESLAYESSVDVESPILEDDIFHQEIVIGRDVKSDDDHYEIEKVADKTLTDTTDEETFLACIFCHEFFNEKALLIEHYKSHDIWSCSICDAQFNSFSKFQKHTTKEHSSVDQSHNVGAIVAEQPTKPYICRYCHVQFTRSTALISHERIHASNDTKSKMSASTQSDDQLDLQLLKAMKIAEDPLAIPKKTRKRRQTKIQTSRATGAERKSVKSTKSQISYKVPCSECNKLFQTRQKMQRHKWIHRKKAFSCEVCAIGFHQQPELDSHRLSEHAEQKKYMCTECGKSFASRQGLWEHNRTHDESKTVPYACRECNKTFTSRSGMLIHLRIHSGDKPFTCTFCEKTFRDGGTLRKHLRIHTGERPHRCPLCEKSFNQKVVMREHIRWVHASNNLEYPEPAPYSCLLCSTYPVLMDREELCMHIVKHSDQIATITKININVSSVIDPYVKDERRPKGIKCDQNIIQRNRQLLQVIDKPTDADSKHISPFNLVNSHSICLSSESQVAN